MLKSYSRNEHGNPVQDWYGGGTCWIGKNHIEIGAVCTGTLRSSFSDGTATVQRAAAHRPG